MEIEKQIRKGNIVWVDDGKREVVFQENPDGRFTISYFPVINYLKNGKSK